MYYAKISPYDVLHYFFLQGPTRVNVGNVRETFFCRTLTSDHDVRAAPKGDFLVDGNTLIEVGEKNKPARQIAGTADAFLALDDMETGVGRRIPLWLFGFVY